MYLLVCVERSLLHKLKLYCKTQRFDYLVFRYERDLSLLQSWLNRCESLCSSDSPYLTTDDVKLHSQLQMLQVKSEGILEIILTLLVSFLKS